jgi:DNA-binding CsgD family transcriptional regulator/tetratricopeptide (TPR) repeat protein
MIRAPSAVGERSLVGREREFGVLRARLDRAGTGRGGTVLVTGEAGIGKSRLARELAREASGRGWRVVDGHCVAVGSEPLRRAALFDLLRPSAQLTRSDRQPQVSRRDEVSSAGVASTGLAAASTEELLERVLAQVDSGSATSPRLVLVEDVHWADRATCEVMMVLARHVAGRPACLVMTCRDDELPPGHHVRGFLAELHRAQLLTTIPLLRLGAADVAMLIQSLVGPVEPARASAVFDRSGGNPLLVEELCATGLAGTDDATGVRPGRLDDRFVDVLLARTARLSSAAMAVGGAVAAAGRFVDEAVLAEVVTPSRRITVTTASDDVFARGLREALDHHLLVRRGHTVGFRHVLVAEAVHGQLLLAERAAVHARWADVLSRRGEDPAVLAHHWAEARDSERALVASVAAGDAAVLALAPRDAVAHYRRALALWDDVASPVALAGRRRTDLCAAGAEAANSAGDPGEALELVALALHDPPPADPVATSQLLERKGWYLLRQGRADAAREAYQAAVEGLPNDAPASDRIRVLAGSVRIWERLRDPQRALVLAGQAVAAATAPEATDADEGRARYMLGRALRLAGQTDAALEQLACAADSAERCLDAFSLSVALLDQADLLAPLGRAHQAVDDALAAANRLRARGHADPHALLCVGVAAGVRFRMGQPHQARTLVEALSAEAGTPVTVAIGHLLTGMLDLDAHALDDAGEHLETARFRAPLLDGHIAGNLAWCRAELAVAESRLDDAHTAVDEGIAQVECTGDDDMLVNLCLLGLQIAADRAAHANPRRSKRARARDAAAVDRYERLLAPLAAHATRTNQPTAGAVKTAWRAERTRLDGASDPAAWAEAAERWAAIGRARAAVLARIRCAEALQARPEARAGTPAVLEQAVKEADVIGSRLLADRAGAVARRAGISLSDAGADPGSEIDDPRARLTSLTRRERDVLDLMVAGSTNRQIGAALYISPKTASVHVSRILSKLGVVTRGEAADVARRAEQGRT